MESRLGYDPQILKAVQTVFQLVVMTLAAAACTWVALMLGLMWVPGLFPGFLAPYWVVWTLLFAAEFVSGFACGQLLPFRRAHWRLRKPLPLWAPILLGASASLYSFPNLAWDFDLLFAGAAAGLLGGLWLSSASPSTNPPTVRADSWGRTAYIRRLADSVEENRCTALLGRVGSGKSWLIDRAVNELGKEEWLSLTISCWKFDGASDAPAQTLEAIVERLSAHMDCGSVAALPMAFESVEAASPSLFARFAARLAGGDWKSQLKELDAQLFRAKLRVVLVVEDFERADKSFHTAPLMHLLWHIREETSSIHLLLAADTASQSTEAESAAGLESQIAKLADRIERMPTDSLEHLRGVLLSLQQTCLEGVVDTYAGRSGEGSAGFGLDPFALLFVRGAEADATVRALNELAGTPGQSRRLVHRVKSDWAGLRGEVDIDELIVLTAIREFAPKAFGFLEARVHDLRRRDVVRLPGVVSRTDEDQLGALATVEPERFESLRHLILFCGLGSGDSPKRTQGAAVVGPRDYFQRIVTGEVPADESPDQDFLQLLSNEDPDAMPRLMRRLTNDPDSNGALYLWQRMGDRLAVDRQLAIAEALLRSMCDEWPPNARNIVKHLLVMSGKWGNNPKGVDWLKAEGAKCVLRGLRVANELSELLHLQDAPTGWAKTVQAAMVATAREEWKTPESLAHALGRDPSPNMLRRFVQGGESDSALVDGTWQWLGTVLNAALEGRHPWALPQVAWLLGDFERVADDDEFQHGIKFSSVRGESFFGATHFPSIRAAIDLAVAKNGLGWLKPDPSVDLTNSRWEDPVPATQNGG